MGLLEEQLAAEREAHEKWRREIHERLDQQQERLEAGEERMRSFEEKIDTNNEMTEGIREDVKEILKIFNAVRGFVVVGGWVGNTLKWVAAVAIAVGVLIYIWKTGDVPPPKKP